MFSPSVFSPSVFSPSVFSPSVFSPSVFSPEAFGSAQTRSLIAVAADPGTADKLVVANTWGNTGRYYVRISGRNGAFSTDGAFRVTVTTGASGCPAGISTIGSAPADVPGAGLKTVILTDPSRLAGTAAEKAALAAKLRTFAARPEVAGAVVDLSADARIAALNAQADANAACPYAKNLVADAIKDVVDSYRANNALRYVTIVGGDNVVPFFRYPDESLLGQESGYVPPVGNTTASEASLRLDYVLGQDAYGSKTEISLRSNSFPVPDLAVGRLVETASEAAGLLDAYTSTNGVVTPHSSLVTGYDFLSDAADSVESDLAAGTAGAGQVTDKLIAPNNISPQDPAAWTATQLKGKLLGPTKHDIVFLAGHFSANSALAADFATSLLTTDLAASTTDFTNTLVFSAGCHSGYNIVDGDAVPGLTLPLDWAQALAQKRATLIAGTGYQYGDTDFLEYSERIYANFAKQLRAGTGAVSIGEALVRAKQAYLATTPDIRGIHEKALLESTVFGLPMLSFDLPSGRTAAPAATPVVASLTPTAGDPGRTLGLTSALVSVDPVFTRHLVPLANLAGGAALTATYYSGGAGVVTNPAEPALPLEQLDVTPPDPSVVLRGVGFRGGSYADETVVPLTGAPTTDLRGVHVPFVSPVFFPMKLTTVNYFAALGGGKTSLLVTPAQHVAASIPDGTSTLRRYDHLSLQLYYSGYLGSAALSAAPDITGVKGEADGHGGVTFSVHAVGDPAAGMQQVWVTYSGDGPSRWASLDLTQDATDSTLWTGTLPGVAAPASLRFLVQAVNGLGLVSFDDAFGSYYRVAGTVGVAAAPPAATALHLQSPPTGGVFGDTTSVTAVLTSGGSGLGGVSVTISIGGSARAATTAADGSVTVAVPLAAVPGPATVSAAFAGDDAFQPAGDSAPFTVAQAPTTLSPFTAQLPGVIPGGDTGLKTTLAAAVGGASQPLSLQSVLVTVSGPGGSQASSLTSDYLGRVTVPPTDLPPGTYSVTAVFAGDATYAGSTRTGTLVIERIPTVLQLQSPPVTGVYGDVKAVTARLTADGSGLGGRTVTVAIAGVARTATTAADGSVTVSLPLSATPGATTVTADFVGTSLYKPSADSTPFTIAKAPTALSPFTPQLADVTPGSATGLLTTLTATVGGAAGPLAGRTVTVTFAGPTPKLVALTTDVLGQVTVPSDGLVPGNYTLTAAYAGDATYLSASRTGTLVVVSERQALYDAIVAELATAGKRDRPELREAARKLGETLGSGYWFDRGHRRVKLGERVFDLDKQVAQALGELLRDRKGDVADATLRGWIATLVEIDRNLAQTAIDEARAAGGDAKRLAEAVREMARAVDDLARGRTTSAIEHFGNAWSKARESLKRDSADRR